MKRCRLRASLFNDQCCQMKSAEAISSTICCSRNKFYGHFEIEDMSYPHACCSKGGWQALLASKYEVAKSGVHPVFVLANSKNSDGYIEPVEQNFPKFNQIQEGAGPNSVVKSGKNFSFTIPEQDPDIIKALQEFNGNVYLTLYRDSKKDYARNMIEFNYEMHERICPFCTITKLNGYIPPHKSGISNSKMSFKRRKHSDDNFTVSQNLQQYVHNAKIKCFLIFVSHRAVPIELSLHVVKNFFLRNIDFSLGSKHATTHAHICNCTIFLLLGYCFLLTAKTSMESQQS